MAGEYFEDFLKQADRTSRRGGARRRETVGSSVSDSTEQLAGDVARIQRLGNYRITADGLERVVPAGSVVMSPWLENVLDLIEERNSNAVGVGAPAPVETWEQPLADTLSVVHVRPPAWARYTSIRLEPDRYAGYEQCTLCGWYYEVTSIEQVEHYPQCPLYAHSNTPF